MYIFLTMQKLAKILFEPLFLIALGGALLAVWRNWKRRDWRFYLLIGGIIFMLLWRSGIAMMSKRYIEIMLFPGLAFAAYFIYKFPLFLYCWLRRRHPGSVPRRYLRWFRGLLLVVLLVVFAAKLSRYNRFDRAIIHGCAVINQERTARRKSRIYEHGLGASRFKYYTRTAVVELPEAQELAAAIRGVPNFFPANFEVVYLCRKEKKSDPAVAELVKSRPQITFQRIFSSPLSNRKKYYLNIYRLKRN